ncbi:MAG: HAMP domain-containing protein, partial [Proteobacteria bacterium]|nr:HAMP domain-containing protein [Pseudomonadota bacterium]
FALSPLKTDFIALTQKSIAFGEKGHSMIVDQYGRVIAHPNAKWQATSKDASKLSIVQLMITGNTGVAEFYSPPMKADMIAGYTNVPETGWGVMVPQPVQELVDNVSLITAQAYIVSGFSILLAIVLGWWISGHLSKPILAITSVAKRLSSGETGIRIPRQSLSVPPELHLLGDTFNKMLDELEREKHNLSSALEKSEESSRAKSDFLAMMSHEIRTPLNSIIGVLDILSDTKMDNDQKQFIQVAGTSAEGLLSILNDFLDFAKLDSGKIAIQNQPLDLEKLIQESKEVFKNQASEK